MCSAVDYIYRKKRKKINIVHFQIYQISMQDRDKYTCIRHRISCVKVHIRMTPALVIRTYK